MVTINNYTPTSLGFAILGLLYQEPRSGYQIRKVFEQTPLGNYSSSPGSIYPALHRLKQKDLIEQIEALPTAASSKKRYNLTEKGANTFTDWLQKPVAKEDVISRIADLLLRFAFMDDGVDVKRKLAFLSAFRDHAQAYCTELEQFRMSATESMPLQGLLALDHGIESYKANVRWAEHALSSLSA